MTLILFRIESLHQTRHETHVCAPAYDPHDTVRDGARTAEPTDLMDLTGRS